MGRGLFTKPEYRNRLQKTVAQREPGGLCAGLAVLRLLPACDPADRVGGQPADPFDRDRRKGPVEAGPVVPEDAIERERAREREIIESRFSFGKPAEKLTAIGSRLGISAERVRQIEERALAKMRRGG